MGEGALPSVASNGRNRPRNYLTTRHGGKNNTYGSVANPGH